MKSKPTVEPWVIDAHKKAGQKRIWGKVTTLYQAGVVVAIKTEETVKPPKKI